MRKTLIFVIVTLLALIQTGCHDFSYQGLHNVVTEEEEYNPQRVIMFIGSSTNIKFNDNDEEEDQEEEGETKVAMIRSLAIYMRQQYLIWNKDTVTDETIFQDIERLSDGKVKIPEGMTLGKVGQDAVYARPGASNNKQAKNGNFRKFNQKKRNNNNQHK